MFPRSRSLLAIAPKSGVGINFEQSRTGFFNKYRHGPQKISNPNESLFRFMLAQWKDEKKRKKMIENYKYVWKWPFIVEWNKNMNEKIGKTHIFEHFDTDESIEKWRAVSDSDSLNGYSTSHISRSPNGHALFHGVLDTTLPDDGLTANAGFSAIIGPRARPWHPFNIEPFWDWGQYNTFEIRFRGDGRKYAIVLNRGSDYDDLGYFDNYAFPIFTHGGPYWQTLRIPFNKFIYNYRDFIQDRQGVMPTQRITFLAIVISDKVDGPFALEIDYMGLRFDPSPVPEHSPYEKYRIKHLRWRPLQVEAPAPQVD